MAPLDPEQRAEVLEMIKSGVQESHAVTEKALFEIRASTQKGHDDMRVTTEAEITAQRARNLEIETKLTEMQNSIASQFLALRTALGAEFDTSKKEAAETRSVITKFQEQKETMIADIEKHFGDFAVKSGEMRELIGQSEGVLQQSLGQMNTLMDGSLRAMNLRFEQYDHAFVQIAAKQSQSTTRLLDASSSKARVEKESPQIGRPPLR